MLEFVPQGQWLAVVPAPVVEEYSTTGSKIFASCQDLTGHPRSRKAYERPHGVSEVAIVLAFPGLRRAHVVGLACLKTLEANARRRFPPEPIRSSSGRA